MHNPRNVIVFIVYSCLPEKHHFLDCQYTLPIVLIVNSFGGILWRMISMIHHTIIREISVVGSSLRGPWVDCEFDFQENRSHDSLQTRPMCCLEPDDVPFIFECVRMLSTYRIK